MAPTTSKRSIVTLAMALFALALATLREEVGAHPICIDATAPFKRANAKFSRCPAYNSLRTCHSPRQEASVVRLPKYKPGMTVPKPCMNRLKNIACAELDQWSGHLFRAEGPGDALAVPKLCQTFCEALYDSCANVQMSHSPFVNDAANFTTIKTAYGNKTAFCTEFADPDYCFAGAPFTLPKPVPFNPSFSICTERVLKAGTSSTADPKVNMLTVPGRDNMLVVGDLNGVIRVYTVNNAATGEAFVLSSTLIDISARVLFSGERGLLGVAMHKNFASNGRFYVSFSCDSGATNSDCEDGDSIVDQYTVANPAAATLTAQSSTRRRIFRTAQPYENHNGGQILFSPDPKEPNLFMMLGDGGAGNDPDNRAQPLNSILGKILRIDVDAQAGTNGLGVAPADNPFVNVTNAQPLIWVNGMRNPWRCSFDKVTYIMYCGDVGQDQVEEIDIITKGNNYGWRKFEGTRTNIASTNLNGNPIHTPPILEYTHASMQSGGYASVTGGYVIRSNRHQGLYGKYIFADLSGPKFLAQESPEGSGQWKMARIGMQCSTSSGTPLGCGNLGSIYSFGEMLSGDVLVADENGDIYRIVEAEKCPTNPPTPAPTASQTPCGRLNRASCGRRTDCRFSGGKCRARSG